MGRHPGPPTTQIAVRLEDELLEQIDAVAPMLKTPWSTPSRSDVIRACIVEGLPSVIEHAEGIAEKPFPAELKKKLRNIPQDKPKPRKPR